MIIHVLIRETEMRKSQNQRNLIYWGQGHFRVNQNDFNVDQGYFHVYQGYFEADQNCYRIGQGHRSFLCRLR